MTKSFKQILFCLILLVGALAFMSSCKKDPVHFLCPVNLSQYCMPDTNGGYGTYGYPVFSPLYVADIKNHFASAGYNFDLNKIKSAHFSSFKIAAADDTTLLTEIYNFDVRIRKKNDTQLGNLVAYKWVLGDSVTVANLDLTGSDINGLFSEEQFTVLIRTFNQWYGNRYICLRPTDIVIDFELDASAKK